MENHIKLDVQEIEKVNVKKSGRYTFQVDRQEECKLTVIKALREDGMYEGDQKGKAVGAVHFHASMGLDKVSVNHLDNSGNRGGFSIELDWDFKHGVCGFKVDDESYEIWELSQKALYSLFFDEEYS